MKHLCEIFGKIILITTLVGCSNVDIDNSSIESSNRISPLYITPMIEGLSLSEEALKHTPQFTSANEAIEWSIDNGYNGVTLLVEALDTLEPGGPSGDVQVGYEMGISLLSLYEKIDEEWKIDEKKVKSYMDLIENVDRPVVVYLMGNHFDTTGELATELAKDTQNLMLLSDGEPPTDDYFGNSVIPFTLLTDESIPVNHYRFEALRYVAEKILELPQEAQDRIIGITIAGEVHHMFPDFTNGTGEYDNMKVTDYSINSVKGFQTWLEQKYRTIEELNNVIGSEFESFTDVEPPSKNVHTETLNSFTEHYDAYAAGTVPISGWVWDPNSVIEELVLYVDDVEVGKIKMGLHRLDVYRAIEEVTSPNVGYRYDLDYRELELGKHNLQVIAKVKDELYLMNQAEVTVVDRNQSPADDAPDNNKKFKSIEEVEGIQCWMDYPRPLTPLYYNPLAVEWNEYRSYQVSSFIDYFGGVLQEAGFSSDILFTHQIYSKINSSWNPELFMEEESIGKDIPYQLGVNLYGGATNSDAIREFLAGRETTQYGVPEYHTQQWKNPEVAMEALEAQYRDGAKFISPYYISIIPEYLKPVEEESLQRLRISQDNTIDGSDQLYQAIIEFAKK